jgi:hypothetical protein
MGYTIRSAEGRIVAIEEDLGNAEEYRMFLNEVAEMEGAGQYTLREATQADVDELAAQEAV